MDLKEQLYLDPERTEKIISALTAAEELKQAQIETGLSQFMNAPHRKYIALVTWDDIRGAFVASSQYINGLEGVGESASAAYDDFDRKFNGIGSESSDAE
jgi:hypothetical protein